MPIHLSEQHTRQLPLKKQTYDRMFSTSIQMPSTKTVISAAASAAAAAMLIRSFARDFVPPELQAYLHNKLRKILNSFSTQFTITIPEFNGLNRNHLFKAAEIYLQPTISPDTKRFRVTMPKKENKISFVMDNNQEFIDSFNGVVLKWSLVSKQKIPQRMYDPDAYHNITITEERYFMLYFHRRYKDMVLTSYLPYIMEKSKEIKDERKTLKLFTLRFDIRMRRGGNLWQSVNLDHPATFDTLAMDPDLKKSILDDLERFVGRKDHYRKVGKAWKRGYLLYGPPGTGKSSLIAAMANYLNFDIYDLELGSVRRNSDLKKLVTTMANKSILVVEDIDCSIDLKKRPRHVTIMNGRQLNEGKEVTLSGLLNFLDGLWSTCGDERIIIFTTNHKDRIDPALVRPGRMDMHIHMSYCSPSAFGTLASNYLRITEHPLFKIVECLLERKKVTPAEVAEQLMMNEEPELALRGLIEFLEKKTEEDEIHKPIEGATSGGIQAVENKNEK